MKKDNILQGGNRGMHEPRKKEKLVIVNLECEKCEKYIISRKCKGRNGAIPCICFVEAWKKDKAKNC